MANGLENLEAQLSGQIRIRFPEHRGNLAPFVIIPCQGHFDDVLIGIVDHRFGQFHPLSPWLILSKGVLIGPVSVPCVIVRLILCASRSRRRMSCVPVPVLFTQPE